MVSYSIWESGRQAATGRFSSLARRHSCPSESFQIASVELGIQAVAALGMFGMWYEQREERGSAQAQLEEPRVESLYRILDQWISEHSSTPGIALDATQALGQEAEKLLGVLVENSDVEVPAVVRGKVSRVVEYMDQLNAFWGATLSALVEVSGSEESWRVAVRPSGEIAQEIVQDGLEDAAYKKPGWWLGAVGADSLVLPIVGPILKGSSAGWLIAHLQDRRQHRQLMKRLSDYPDLVSLYVAKNQLLVVAAMVTRFLAAQPLGAHAVLYARSISAGESAVLLGPQTPRRWYARPFTRPWEMRLAALRAPRDS